MLVLDIPQRSPDNFAHVDVPLYHRVHLSLAADIPVYSCLLAGTNQSHQPELIISPFDFSKWDRMWRLNLSLKDRPGLLYEVCEILGKSEVNILAAESSTVEEQDLFHLEMVINFQDPHQLDKIHWSVLAHFCSDIKLLPNGKPRMRIHRLEQLFHTKQAYERQIYRPIIFSPVKCELKAELREDLRPTNQQNAPRVPTFRFSLPREMRDILKVHVRSAESGEDGYYLRQSDTKDRFLRILFFRNSDPVIHCRIEYAASSRAVADITGALKNHGFSIITSYMSPSDLMGRSRIEVVARCQAIDGSATADVKQHLESALSKLPEIADLGLVIGYPRTFGRKWENHPIKSASNSTPSNISLPALTTQKLLDDLKTLYASLFAELTSGAEGTAEHSSLRYALVCQLLQQYDQSVGTQAGYAKSLFVSCHFEGNQLNIIERKAREKGFNVVTGKDLLRASTITDGLLKRISCCTHFLGVWSRDGAQAIGNEFWPSPWILWEFGAAEAFQLEWRLLISKDIADMAWRLASHRQHAVFDFDFETKVSEILDVLLSVPAKRLPFAKRAGA
jgi:hypothetical protein